MNNPATIPAVQPTSPALRTRRAPAVVRILLGLPFAIFGLNSFLNFIPQPETPLP